jgi:phosphoribosylglycinamide formyltransferase-1
MDGLMDMLELKKEGYLPEKVRELKERAVLFLEEIIEQGGYFKAVQEISAWFVQQFRNRILNIHPALLPSFPGLDGQKQAFDYGVKISGCTVHFVDEHLDHGPIIVQKAVPVLGTDDDHMLAARILEQEHLAYSEAIRLVLEGNWEIVGRRVVVKNAKSALGS